MFIKAEDGKIYNADHIVIVEVVNGDVHHRGVFIVQATLTQSASPGQTRDHVVLAHADTKPQAQILADKLIHATGGMVDMHPQPPQA